MGNEAPFDWKNPDYGPVYAARIARLKKIRETPGMLAGLKEFYKARPVEFINDWGQTFDPRNVEVDRPAVVPFVLFPKQVEFIQWLYDRWRGREDGLAEKSRDMGVSWLCVAFAVWMITFWPGTVVGFGSRKEEYVDKLGDPKSLFWKVRAFIDLLPVEFRPGAEKFDSKVHAPHMRIINPENSSTIVGEAGDNIGRGNRASIYIKDESAFYDRPEAIDAALSQTANCKIDVSTPNGSGNPFYRKAHGGKIKKFVFDWTDDPRKDQAWYDKQVATLDPVIVAQEIDRDYESSVTNAFIPGVSVLDAMARGPADVVAHGRLRVGIDVARFGDDKSVILFRRGRVVLKLIELSKSDITQVAGRARAEIVAYGERPEQIAVDTIGLGAGVADILRAWYPDTFDRRSEKRIKTVVDVNSALVMDDGVNYNLRAAMWSEMREWIKTASLPNDPELKSDLTALRYLFKGGLLLIESKEDAKRRGIKSPDRADALALTFAVPTLAEPERKPIKARPFATYDAAMGALG